jgi:hypothetical protein
MITKTALIAVLTLGTVVAASASEFDPNLQHRYPQASATQTFQSRNVALTGRQAPLINNQSSIDRNALSWGGGY